ncbi:hypothetical protein HAX54_021303 [Datura stramonium]|uniref:Gnk2-homologous domain-containing protein n=1 Tax=Datura stramonium TaxID=4076 RepID=A0ABS8UT76_DATST|nr:hypothetical protein [Datura stramonium]
MAKILRFLLIFMYIFFSFFFSIISSDDSSIDGFIYGGCSQVKYSPDSPYGSNLNSLLTSLVNSATYSSYNKYSIVGSTQQDMINGLYQCRGDLSMPDCATCLARSVSQITELCPQACGGALQLQGCFVKYDNVSFLGSEDKTVVMKKCGPSNGFDLDEMGRRDAVLGGLMGGNGLYRVGGSADVQGIAQCVGDLSMAQCQDCLSEAIGRLRKECGGGVYGDMFLGKCYARYTTKGTHLYAKPNHHDSHGETATHGAISISLAVNVLAHSERGLQLFTSMALEWVVLGYAAGAEAIMLLLLTVPGLDPLRKGLIAVTRNLLKPFLSIVPFCLFLLMDIYWKYENRPTCESSDSCSPSEYLRHQKSIMKSQRNALLIACALVFYWLLYSVTGLVVKVEQLNKRVEKLKASD